MRLISTRTDWLRWCAAFAVAALIAAGCGNDDDATTRTVQQSSPTPTVQTGDDQQSTPTVQTPTDDGSSTGDDTETPSDAGGIPSDGAQPVPMPEDGNGFGSGTPQPRRADSDDTAGYITKLMVWLASDDIGRESGECYANVFLETIEENRLEEMAEIVDTTQLEFGLPDDLLTEEEMSLFVDNSRHCTLKAIMGTFNTVANADWLLQNYSVDFLDSIELDPETFTVALPSNFNQLTSDCAGAIEADTTNHEMLIRSSLFNDDDGRASDHIGQQIYELCDNSIQKALEDNIFIPQIAISFASEFSLKYEDSLCLVEADTDALSQMESMYEDLLGPTDMDDMDDIDPESLMAEWTEELTELFTECDIPLDRLQVYSSGENRNESPEG